MFRSNYLQQNRTSNNIDKRSEYDKKPNAQFLVEETIDLTIQSVVNFNQIFESAVRLLREIQ